MTIDNLVIENTQPNETIKIKLSEQIQVKKTTKLSNMCHLTKDLYNKANYLYRHRYFFLQYPYRLDYKWLKELKNKMFSEYSHNDTITSVTRKYLKIKNKIIKKYSKSLGRQGYGGIGRRMTYNEIWQLLKFCPEYNALPSQTAQQTLRILQNNWKSYYKKIEQYWGDKKKLPLSKFIKKYPNKPNIPKYKKKDGETLVIFTNQQCKIRDGFLIFPKKGYKRSDFYWLPPIKTRIEGVFNHVRIIPKGITYVIEIVYEKEINDLDLNKNNICAIDLGVRNIVTMVNNIGKKPIVVKGGIVKSINQYYNKKRKRLMSIKDKQNIKIWTGQLQKLDLKRNNKIYDCFHKISRKIIEYCVKNNIGTIVIGYNESWKQNSKMGKKNNQNFVSIPFLELIKKIQYKSVLIGNHIVLINESYTSKCSFLDNEEVKKHSKYKGKRINRGLFKALNGKIINADVNGAYNILKKAFPKAILVDGIEDVVLHPCRLIWN